MITFLIYLSSVGSVLILILRPNLLSFEQRQNLVSRPKVVRGVQTFYNLIKANWQDYLTDNKKVVQGLVTCLSAPLLSIGLFLTYISTLLLGDGLCPSLLLAMICSGLFLYVDSYHRLRQAKTVQDLLHVPWTSVIGKQNH